MHNILEVIIIFEGLLPIDSVVLLKNSTKKVMVIGVCQKQVDAGKDILWDYAGCVYPEGYLGGDQVYLFNGGQIEKIFVVGYQDEDRFTFKAKADGVLKQLKGEE